MSVPTSSCSDAGRLFQISGPTKGHCGFLSAGSFSDKEIAAVNLRTWPEQDSEGPGLLFL